MTSLAGYRAALVLGFAFLCSCSSLPKTEPETVREPASNRNDIEVETRTGDDGLPRTVVTIRQNFISEPLAKVVMLHGQTAKQEDYHVVRAEGLYIVYEGRFSELEAAPRPIVPASFYRQARFEPYARTGARFRFFFANSLDYGAPGGAVELDARENLSIQQHRRQLVRALMQRGEIGFQIPTGPRTRPSGFAIDSIECRVDRLMVSTCTVTFPKVP